VVSGARAFISGCDAHASFFHTFAGVTVKDVDVVFSKTRHTTCISPSLGGSGNPSVITARGIVCAIQVHLHSYRYTSHFSFCRCHWCLHSLATSDAPQAAAEWLGETLQGKLVAIQGCGQVGLPLCRFLVAEGARVVVSESSAHRAADVGDELRQLGVELRTTPFGDNSILCAKRFIYFLNCALMYIFKSWNMYEDAFCVSPNAWGGVLNKDTIPNIKAKAVCGACNNQLQFASDARLLMQVCAISRQSSCVHPLEMRTSRFTPLFWNSVVWFTCPTSYATAWA
jgi:leucine dehydrogenase